MKRFLRSPKWAKIFGWAAGIGNAAVVLSQNGFHAGSWHGHDFISIIASLAVALGVHGASNSNGTNPSSR